MDRGAWQATVHGVTKTQSRLSNFHFTLLLMTLKRDAGSLSATRSHLFPKQYELNGFQFLNTSSNSQNLNYLSRFYHENYFLIKVSCQLNTDQPRGLDSVEQFNASSCLYEILFSILFIYYYPPLQELTDQQLPFFFSLSLRYRCSVIITQSEQSKLGNYL